MRKKRVALMAGLVLTGLAFGFLIGSAVFAGGGEPGSAADPLVARSYVDEQVAAYISGLEKKAADLSARALELETALAKLQRQVGITPIKPGEPVNSGTPTTPTTPTAPGSDSVQGRKIYISAENSAVNLRTGPGTGYDLVVTVVRGSGSEPMTVLSQSGEWYRVKTADGHTGWVAGWLMTAPA